MTAANMKRQNEILRGYDQSIEQRLAADLAAFRALPAVPFEACDKSHGRVSPLSLVRYRGNDYSVPTEYGHRIVTVKGFVDRVVISHANQIIAEHPRSYAEDDFVFNPLHYLALLEQKTRALDQAAPLQGWKLPEVFAVLRRLLEAREDTKGRREFVQVLRLLEVFPLAEVTAAIRDAIDRGAISFDVVKMITLCRIEKRPVKLDMTAYPYLAKATVKSTSPCDYLTLVGKEAA